MLDSSDSSASILFDLADQLLTDGAEGRLKPMSHYLARFPGHEETVAREYIATSRALGLEPPDERSPTADGSSSSADGGSAAHAASARASSRSRPETIGPYRILDVLGRGGQGTVYRALDSRLDRLVALKVLSLSLASVSQGRRSRFRREAAIVSRLDHPGICTILDADLEGDTPYIAMRFVEGETLAMALARAREKRDDPSSHSTGATPTSASRLLAPTRALELAEALTFFERAARALHAAHEAGVVHRDVKPGNIMVSTDGAPVILDFGLARGDEDESAHLTRSDEIFGTPAYISPEQLESGKNVDRRTDVYSLGVVLYECLTLERPFQGDTGAALADAIRRSPMPSPLRANPSLSSDLVVVLETALEKDVARRYATALEFAEELRRVREYEPIRARPAGPLLKLTRWSQRNPVLATATLGSIATLSIALTVALVLLRRVGEERNQKEQALGLYEAAFYRDQAATMLGLFPLSALHCSIQAGERDPGFESNRMLLKALDALYQKQLLVWEGGHGNQVDISPTSDRLLTACADGIARVWDPESGTELQRLDAGAGALECGRFSPDGKRVVAACESGKVLVWSLEERDAEPLVLAGHVGEAHWADFSPDGATIVTAGRDRVAILWDARTGRELRRLTGHTGNASEARFVGEGRFVLTRSGEPVADHTTPESDRTARLFDAVTGEQLLVLDGHTDQVRSVASSRDLRWIATASTDGTVRVFELSRGARPELLSTRELRMPGRALSVDIARDGSRLAVAFDAGARVIDLETCATRYELPSHDRRAVVWIAFSPDDERIATVAYDSAVRIFRAEDGTLERTCRGDTRTVQALTWSQDGRWIATWQRKPQVDLWYAGERPFLQVLRGHTDEVVTARFDARGERVVSASKDGTARLWSARDGAALLLLAPPADDARPLIGASFHPDGTRVLTTDAAGRARVLDARDGRELARVDVASACGIAAAFDPTGALVAVPSGKGGVRVVELATGRATNLAAHEGELTCARFSPDGRVLATGGLDRRVCVFELHPGSSGELATIRWRTEPFKTPRYDLDRVFDVAFDPSGTRLAAAYQSMDYPLLDLATGATLANVRAPTLGRIAFGKEGRELVGTGKWVNAVTLFQIEGGGTAFSMRNVPFTESFLHFHVNALTSLAYSRESNRFVTGSLDRTARVWDSERRECFAAYEGHQDAVWDVDVSPDDTRIVTASADKTVRLWPSDLLAEARRFEPAAALAAGRLPITSRAVR
ncbi:MAG: protein kinase [Planctomycetes bacterium]|nr:protein kinase [Planctomycetota bacterium]